MAEVAIDNRVYRHEARPQPTATAPGKIVEAFGLGKCPKLAEQVELCMFRFVFPIDVLEVGGGSLTGGGINSKPLIFSLLVEVMGEIEGNFATSSKGASGVRSVPGYFIRRPIFLFLLPLSRKCSSR